MDSLLEVLRARAEREPERVVYTYLRDGEGDALDQSFAQLWARTRSIAAELRARGLAGSRALLLYPPGLDYAPALFACFLAGVVAVPEGPPDPRRPERNLGRIRAVAANARVAAVLTVAGALGVRELAPEGLRALPWIPTDTLERAPPSTLEPLPTSESLAYLQYTSGSTSDPRGVVLSHAKLAANCRAITELYATDASSVMVSWVPTFHDLGLVYSIALPVWSGCRAVTLAAADFARRPRRWLEAISRYRGTHSIAPDSAYAITALKARPTAGVSLDLSCWETALNGAEPVRASTERAFIDAFASVGFRAEAFSHSWGLSEATAMVTGEPRGEGMNFLRLDGQALARHRVVLADPGSARIIEVASCGTWAQGTEVLGVDPERHCPVAAGEVGELWVRGPSVGAGYFEDQRASEANFGARTREGLGPWLRTGDRGFVRDGRVYVTGRIKELLIVRGHNHYPHDLELSFAGRHPALRPGGSVAFSIEGAQGEQVVIVAEVRPKQLDDPEALRREIRAGLADHGLSPACIALVAPGSVPRTTSGKPRRGETRARLLAGALDTIDQWWAPKPELAPSSSRSSSLAVILTELAALTGVPASQLDPSTPLAELGLDSIAIATLAERLSQRWGRDIDTTRFFDHPSADALAAWHEAPPCEAPSSARWTNAELRAKLAQVDVEALALAPWLDAFMALPDTRSPEPSSEATLDELADSELLELAAHMLEHR